MIVQQVITSFFRFDQWFMIIVFVAVQIFISIHHMCVVYTLLLD